MRVDISLFHDPDLHWCLRTARPRPRTSAASIWSAGRCRQITETGRCWTA